MPNRPSPVPHRKSYPSHSNANQTILPTTQVYPLIEPSLGYPNTEMSKVWPPQNNVYPSSTPYTGQSFYVSNALGMDRLPQNLPASSMATAPSAQNPQMHRSPYVLPYQDTWNNRYDSTIAVEQPAWGRPDLGHSGYQQPSPSRSDGSASTHVSSLSSPRVKMEHQPEQSPYITQYPFEHVTSQQPVFVGTGAAPIASPYSHRPYTTPRVEYGRPNEGIKYEFDPYDMESLSLSADPRILSPDVKSKRGYTTPDTATCTCGECGMVFQRSNNLKTHMKTHEKVRDQPNKCEFDGCGCAFARKTDLVRHQRSVSSISGISITLSSLILVSGAFEGTQFPMLTVRPLVRAQRHTKETRGRWVFETTGGDVDTASSSLHQALILPHAVSIAQFVAIPAPIAVDVTHGFRSP